MTDPGTPDPAPAVLEDPAPAAEEGEQLPTHKADLVALAIDRGIPSYEAWDMTVKQLTKRLES